MICLQCNLDHVENTVGQLGTGRRRAIERPLIDSNRRDSVADVGCPILGNAGGTVHDAPQCAERCTGTVGIVAAVDGKDHRALEVPAAVQHTEHGERDIGRSFKPAQVRGILHELVACVLPVNTVVIAVKQELDGTCHTAVCGNLGQTDVDERTDIGNHECCGFHCRDKDRRIGTLTRTVVDAGVFSCVTDGRIGCSRCHTSPDLGTDPCAVGMLPGIHIFAGQRRHQTGAHVVLADAVFVPFRRNEVHPAFAENLCVNGIRTKGFHRVQPDELQVKVVVWQNNTCGRGKALNVVDLLSALIRGTHRTADVFADPAGMNLIAQNSTVQVNHNRISSHIS